MIHDVVVHLNAFLAWRNRGKDGFVVQEHRILDLSQAQQSALEVGDQEGKLSLEQDQLQTSLHGILVEVQLFDAPKERHLLPVDLNAFLIRVYLYLLDWLVPHLFVFSPLAKTLQEYFLIQECGVLRLFVREIVIYFPTDDILALWYHSIAISLFILNDHFGHIGALLWQQHLRLGPAHQIANHLVPVNHHKPTPEGRIEQGDWHWLLVIKKDAVVVALASLAYLEQSQVVLESCLVNNISCLSDVDDVRGLLCYCEERIELVHFTVLDEHASKVFDWGMNVWPKVLQITDLLIVLHNIQAVFLVRHDQLLIENLIIFLSIGLQ